MKAHPLITICCIITLSIFGMLTVFPFILPSTAKAASSSVEYNVIDIRTIGQDAATIRQALNEAAQQGWRVKASLGLMIILEK